MLVFILVQQPDVRQVVAQTCLPAGRGLWESWGSWSERQLIAVLSRIKKLIGVFKFTYNTI